MDAVSGHSMENCRAGLSFTVKFMKLRPLWPPSFDFTSKEIFSVPALVGVSVSISVALVGRQVAALHGQFADTFTEYCRDLKLPVISLLRDFELDVCRFLERIGILQCFYFERWCRLGDSIG